MRGSLLQGWEDLKVEVEAFRLKPCLTVTW